MKETRWLLCLWIGLAVGCTTPGTHGSARFTPLELGADQVVLAERIEFVDANGKTIVPLPGVYRVVVDRRDRLALYFGGSTKPIVIRAQRMKSKRQGGPAGPSAALVAGEGSPARALWLRTADGTAYASMGTREGERARGTLLDSGEPALLYEGTKSLSAIAAISAPASGQIHWNRFQPIQVRWSGSSYAAVGLVHRVTSRVVRQRLVSGSSVDLGGLHPLDPGLYDVSVTDLATGIRHSVAIYLTGSVRSLSTSLALAPDRSIWKYGGSGSTKATASPKTLGCGETEVAPSPTKVAGAYETLGVKARAVASGHDHHLAIALNGEVLAWGANNDGQLGFGDTTARQVPTSLVATPLGKRVVAVAAGSGFSLALRNDGTVWAWGANSKGQCGQDDGFRPGGQHLYHSPVQVLQSRYRQARRPILLTGVVAIAAGKEHCLALKQDGTVWGWGSNDSSQLGEDRFETSGGFTQAYDGVDNDPKVGAITYEGGARSLVGTDVLAIAACARSSLFLTSGTPVRLGGLGENIYERSTYHVLADEDIAEVDAAIRQIGFSQQDGAYAAFQSYALGASSQAHHWLLVDPAGKWVWMRGANDYGQLGGPDKTSDTASHDFPGNAIVGMPGRVRTVVSTSEFEAEGPVLVVLRIDGKTGITRCEIR